MPKTMKETGTKFDKIKSRIQNNPILASLMVIGMIIIALSTFTDAAKKLLDLVKTESRPDINGQWTAKITYPWSNVSKTETFYFEGEGVNVNGNASYLGSKQLIMEGKVKEGQIEFKTKSTEIQDYDRKTATHHYRGKIMDDEIRFVLETYGGFSSKPTIQFIAFKVVEKGN